MSFIEVTEWGEGMAQSLYPTFDLPKIVNTETPAEKRKYKQSMQFDFSTGDFARDGAGRPVLCSGKEAWLAWCLKAVMTERKTRLAYSGKIGTEMREAQKQPNAAAVQSAIERTITEALMVNPLTEYVRGFAFDWQGSDELSVTFIVKGQDWEEQALSLRYS